MFDALEISLETIAALREPLRVIRSTDGDLYRQMRRAGSSIPLNIAEGGRRVGKDRKHLWRVALGSAEEVRVALRTAVAWGDLDEARLVRPLALLDRVTAMLWKMTR
ncbi:MAG: four helix bundle protein [Planctomycetes bacterium]|nr:four helix bundle protein [Planctomycetota bacterium]